MDLHKFLMKFATKNHENCLWSDLSNTIYLLNII